MGVVCFFKVPNGLGKEDAPRKLTFIPFPVANELGFWYQLVPSGEWASLLPVFRGQQVEPREKGKESIFCPVESLLCVCTFNPSWNFGAGGSISPTALSSALCSCLKILRVLYHRSPPFLLVSFQQLYCYLLVTTINSLS